MIYTTLIYILLILLVFIIVEFGGNIWHRIAHTNYIPNVAITHFKHHTQDLLDDAMDDFIWLIFIIFAIGIMLLYISRYISKSVCILIFTVLTLDLMFNAYMHMAYHTQNHWLESYTWFLHERDLHLQHHNNPKTNYSIVTHFTDRILGSFDESEHDVSIYNINSAVQSDILPLLNID